MNPIFSSFIEQCFQQFKIAYAAQNYGIACDAFMQAIAAEPDPVYRYFATQASGQLVFSLGKTGRLDEAVSLLDAALSTHLHMHLMYYGPEDITDYFIRLREENIANGLPSVLLVTQEKSGSISIANIFTSGFNLPSFAYSLVTERIIPSWIQDYARGGACYATHLKPHTHVLQAIARSGIEKIAVHVRDPRQTLVSLMHHVTRYPDQMIEVQHAGFNDAPEANKLAMLMTHYVECVRWLEGWVEAAKTLPIYFSTFESFREDEAAFIDRYLTWYGGDRQHFSAERATTKHTGTDYHFRKGETQEWRRVMPPDLQERCSLLLSNTIKDRFGWPE